MLPAPLRNRLVTPRVFQVLYLAAIAVAMIGWAWVLAGGLIQVLDN